MKTLTTLLARLFGPQHATARPPRRVAPRARPRLEALEDRAVPSTYHVNSLLDTGTGTGLSGDLRNCITQSDAHSGQDTIEFAVHGQITLNSALPALSDNTTIQGPGAASLTVSGNHANRVFFVNAGVTVSISGLTIADGSTLGVPRGTAGAGLFNQGTLTVSGSIFARNTAPFVGGGIGNEGTATVSACSICCCTADTGGGIYNLGTLTVSASTLCCNQARVGGGLFNYQPLTSMNSLTVSNSTIAWSSSSYSGGGLFIESLSSSAPVTLTNVTISANWANTGDQGANGGGLFITSLPAAALPVLRNTLIAGNFSGPTGATRDDVFGAVDGSSSHNLIGDGTRMTGITNGVSGNLVGSADSPIDPLLGPLQDNGGPTQTMALLPGSPARGAGSLDYASDTDQRGLPRVVGGMIDIGAYQTQDYGM
jgi:hypothetical protein